VKCGDEKPVDVLKISAIPSMPESRSELLRNGHQPKNSSKKMEMVNDLDVFTTNTTKHKKIIDEKEHKTIHINTDDCDSNGRLSERSSPIEMIQLLTNRLSFPSSIANLNRQLPKTSGVCTQSSSTSGPSRTAVSSQTEKTLTNSFRSTNSKTNHRGFARSNNHQPPVSSVAVTTFAQSTSTFSDPRMEVKNITPPEVRLHSTGWDEEIGKNSKGVVAGRVVVAVSSQRGLTSYSMYNNIYNPGSLALAYLERRALSTVVFQR